MNGLLDERETEQEALSQVVVAGAGTGKTHALVNAYLFALLGLDGGDGEPRTPARVLAITFTDKAASEMRRRVALRLQALVRDPRADADVNARAEELERKVPETRVLEKMSRQLTGAPICTFHSLCSLLLRDLALNAGIDPGFTLLDPVTELELLAETAEAVVLDRLAAGDEDVAELSARFSLRRLGAGSGLVDALVAVQQKLAERGVTPEDIHPAVLAEDAGLRVTELRASADDAIKALWEAVRGADKKSQSSLRGAFLAYRRFRALLDASDPDDEHDLARQFLAVRDGLQQARLRGQALVFARDTALSVVQDLGVALCDRVTAPHAAAVRSLLIELEERVRREKDQLGVLAFGDMLLRTRDLLRDDPSVRARVKGRFDRVLVDEYQDTSPVQEDLVALLAEAASRGDRVPKGERAMGKLVLEPGRLFVVGDPKQSIYGFRGADVTVFQHTLDVVTRGTPSCPPSGEARPLSTSWRSRPPILSLVNQVAMATLPAGGAGIEIRPEDLLQPKREGEGKAGALWTPVEVGDLGPEQAEGIVVGRKVRELLDEGLVVSVGGRERPCRAGDIAILIRRVKAGAPIVRALAHQGVPAILTGGEGFFQRPEVMDLIAALQLIVEPEDELATLTVLRSPLVAVPDDVLVQLTEGIEGWRRGLSWRDLPAAARAAGVEERARTRIEALDRLLSSLRAELHRLPASRMVDALVDEGGYALGIGVERDAGERLANVEKLRALCEGRPGDAFRTIHRLWAWLDDPPKESIASVADPELDAVRIMTMHQAKGLEFPIVVVADAGSQLPIGGGDIEVDFEVGLAVSHRGRPIDACSWRTGHLATPPAIERVRKRRRSREDAELARLLYVALTRARDFVFVIGEEREQNGRRASGLSLRRLLEKGRMADPKAFVSLLPTEKVPARLGPPRPLPVTRVPDVDGEREQPPMGPVRLVPSALAEPLPQQVDALITGGQVIEGNVSARRRGRLSHRLIGRLGELLAAGALPSERDVERAALAGARSLGEEVDAPDTRALLSRVVTTVHGPLRRLVEAGCLLSFEEPVRTTLGPRAVLVGAADLVARGPGFTAVIELKSSRRGAQDPATGVQLGAYARALEQAGEQRVLVAAWVIGDEEPRAPARIDEVSEERLDELIAAAAAEGAD